MDFSLDGRAWAEQQFSSCDLGDRRRTKRLVQVAADVADNPAGTFPEQLADGAALKGAYRRPRPQGENASQRFRRQRESRVWGDVIRLVGSPPEGVEWVHVFDRGGDDFEVFCRLLDHGGQWVVRASSLHRWIDAGGGRTTLAEHLPTLPVAGA